MRPYVRIKKASLSFLIGGRMGVCNLCKTNSGSLIAALKTKEAQRIFSKLIKNERVFCSFACFRLYILQESFTLKLPPTTAIDHLIALDKPAEKYEFKYFSASVEKEIYDEHVIVYLARQGGYSPIPHVLLKEELPAFLNLLSQNFKKS